MNQIANAPANAIQKARNAVDARRERSEVPVNEVLAGTDIADQPAVKPGTPGTKAPAMTTSSREVAPGVTAITSVEAGAEASPAFRAFVTGCKINGATPVRAVINGRPVRSGEIVDSGLGIIFDGYDPEKNQLRFKDRTGATVLRRFP